MATDEKYTPTSSQARHEFANQVLAHAVSSADFSIIDSSTVPAPPSADTLSGTFVFIAVTEDGLHHGAWLYLPLFMHENAAVSASELGKEVAKTWSRARGEI